MGDLRAALALNGEKSLLLAKMKGLEDAANEWLKSYPSAGLRENVEVLLVAIAVAMAIRTFFLQPFKIPTGSMQPTLYGITPNKEQNCVVPMDVRFPSFIGQFISFWFSGVQYKEKFAQADGEISNRDDTPQRFLLFNLKQSFWISGVKHTVWFPPDDLWKRAGLDYGSPKVYRKGDPVVRLRT